MGMVRKKWACQAKLRASAQIVGTPLSKFLGMGLILATTNIVVLHISDGFNHPMGPLNVIKLVLQINFGHHSRILGRTL